MLYGMFCRMSYGMFYGIFHGRWNVPNAFHQLADAREVAAVGVVQVLVQAHQPTLHRLYLGIAEGMPIARVWAWVLEMTASEKRSFWLPACPHPRNGHAVGDAEIEPI